jgi:hypothetical protein
MERRTSAFTVSDDVGAIMLNIATPQLNDTEWRDVRRALIAVEDCGCNQSPAAGSLRARLGRMVDTVLGPASRPAALPADLQLVREFLCESRRGRRIAERLVPALASQGFNRAQIEAMALLGA